MDGLIVFEALWVELKQILHLKVGCSDFGPVRDGGSLPYCSSKLTPIFFAPVHIEAICPTYLPAKLSMAFSVPLFVVSQENIMATAAVTISLINFQNFETDKIPKFWLPTDITIIHVQEF